MTHRQCEQVDKLFAVMADQVRTDNSPRAFFHQDFGPGDSFCIETRGKPSDNGSLAVGALTLEFKETRANAALLRQIAQRSGGTFFTPEELRTLPAVLAASGTFSPVRFEEAREQELWHLPAFFLLVVLLLTTEWVLRKRSGMV